ncbi:uncharacterized protein METZ01_LOCUS350786, partial [marine metagenome]
MGYDQVPDDCLKGLRHGCHCLWIHGGDDNAHIRYLSGEATISANNSADSGTHFLCVLQGSHQIHAHVHL